MVVLLAHNYHIFSGDAVRNPDVDYAVVQQVHAAGVRQVERGNPQLCSFGQFLYQECFRDGRL